jgi:hypothetical protein
MLAALQLQKLYVDRHVAADKLASVTAVADKRSDEWRRLITPAAGVKRRKFTFAFVMCC